MTLYAGEAVRIRASVLDPETKKPLTPVPAGEVHFWHEATGDPAKNPVVRDSFDKGPFSLTERTEEMDLVAYVDTTGWAAGRWYYRVTVIGTNYKNWEYGSLKLKD